ncbi:YceD family protein [Thioalkalicoccus limnaeus]|uniref:Large ribosomal RNA subunit accumulation protein YceD n=1 Tax=Thioalkalicoccus limnaeus TaxID=120681 RepID=A0ABV4BA14_9GAMM
MSEGLPEDIDWLRAVKSGLVLEGVLPLVDLPRLREALYGRVEGMLCYSIAFERDQAGRALIRGRLSTALRLECQRCLGPMAQPVDVELMVVLVTAESSLEALPEEYDPLVVEGGSVRLRDLIEDELLLAIPLVPRHPLGQCADPGLAEGDLSSRDGARPNPFAVLAGWRRHPSN